MAGDVTKLRRTVGGCRIVIIVLSVLIIALVVALAVTVVKMQEKLEEVQSAHCKQGLQNINLDPPKILTPFHDLTAEEIHNVKEFLYSQDDLNLVVATELSVNSSYIFTMELKIPNKAQTLNYLDKGRQQPAREANVVIFRGDTPETYIQEYTVGPLPLPTYKKDSRTRPFRFRPFTHPELEDVLTKIGKEVQTEVGTLLEESYGGMIWTEGCVKNCLGFQLQIPESSAITGNTHNRRFWLWLYQVVEYFSLHPLDFLVLTDVTGNTEDQYNIVKITYAGNTFNSLKELQTAYKLNTVNKVKIPFPVNDDQLFSSMHRRGKEFPEKPARRPLEFEPDGKRYSINGRHISYMGWQFHVRLSPISGPQLFDIRYQGERIVYELSLQEIGVFYSAHNPAHRFSDFADSVAMVGTRVRTLVTGADCPEHSTYLSATYATESSEEASVVDRAFCVFEHNTGTPLRRHHARSVFEGIFYEGVQDVVLTVRTITTVVNYDYIIDFIFHQNGGIEVKIIPTGYILTSFRMPEEDEYGFRLRDHIIGNIHHHIFNYKVDLDIKGTSNRFETLNLVPEEVDNSKWSTDPNAKYAQTRMVKNLVKSEKAAAIKYNFDAPKYITFYNNEERTTYGVPRAYRLLMRGMSKQVQFQYASP